MGISFILLAGGEPMLRRDIIEAAGKKQNIMFPIFTNGTFMDERYFELFDRRRNLLPVMSIEGEREITDARRGKGIYDRLVANMEELDHRELIFGASVTVTTENIREVTSEDFLKSLGSRMQGRDLRGVCPRHGGKQGAGSRRNRARISDRRDQAAASFMRNVNL